MKCERCGQDTGVERYEVDDYVGYLCLECREVWERFKERA